MATESIFTPIVIGSKKEAKQFEQAIKASEKTKTQDRSRSATFTQPSREDIKKLFK